MDWHRLFGLLLADFCTGLPFEVEVEVDLSKRKQRLDIVLLRKHPGPCSERFPDGLDDLTAYNLITFKSHQEPDGVYDVRWGTDFIRIVVVRNLPQEKHNALMHLFSAAAKDCRYGTENYRLRSSRTSSIVEELLAHYREEGISMPYTIDDFERDVAKKYQRTLTIRERLEGLTPAQILQGLSLEGVQELREMIEKSVGKQKGAGNHPRKAGKGSRRRKP